ncbi:MAG: hypothetical protein FWF84_03880 [Kiritimatiellaeota bacterium]|nr:hypothetical protein [Kiritimatiellota bacterium]
MKKAIVCVAVCVAGVMAVAQSYAYAGSARAPRTQSYAYVAEQDPLEVGTTTPFMLALFDPVQAPQSNWSVQGFRLNLFYSDCYAMRGLDIGVINSCVTMKGWQIGVINMCDTVQGWQVGVLFNSARLMKGWQLGLINHAEQAVGVQLGLVNIIEDNDIPFLPIFNMSF